MLRSVVVVPSCGTVGTTGGVVVGHRAILEKRVLYSQRYLVLGLVALVGLRFLLLLRLGLVG